MSTKTTIAKTGPAEGNACEIQHICVPIAGKAAAYAVSWTIHMNTDISFVFGFDLSFQSICQTCLFCFVRPFKLISNISWLRSTLAMMNIMINSAFAFAIRGKQPKITVQKARTPREKNNALLKHIGELASCSLIFYHWKFKMGFLKDAEKRLERAEVIKDRKNWRRQVARIKIVLGRK